MDEQKSPQTGRPKKPKRRNEGEAQFWVRRTYHGFRYAARVAGHIDAEKNVGYYRWQKKHDATSFIYAVDLASGQSVGPLFGIWKSAAEYIKGHWEDLQIIRSDSDYQISCAEFKLEIEQSKIMEQKILSEIDYGREEA